MTCNCLGDAVPASPSLSSFSFAALCGCPAQDGGCAGTSSLYWSNFPDNQAPLFCLPTEEPSRAGGPRVALAFPERSSRNRKARSIELAPSLSKICPQCFVRRESAGAEEGLGTRCLAPVLLLTTGLRPKMSASRGSAACWDSELPSKPSRVRKSSSASPAPCKSISSKTVSSCSHASSACSSSKFETEDKGLSVRDARPPAGAEAGREGPVELERPCLLRNFCLHGSGFKPTHSTEPIPGVPVAGASFGTKCG